MKLLFICILFFTFSIISSQTSNQKKKEKTVILCKENKNNKPLYIIDKRIVNTEKVKRLKKKNIRKIKVIKREKALKKYGEKGKNGVIIIYTKKYQKELNKLHN